MRNIIHFISIFIFFAGCNQSDCQIDEEIKDIPVDIKVERLEENLFAASSKSEIAELINKHPVLKNFFLVSQQYPHDSVLINQLYRRIQNPYIDTLYTEVKEVFGDLSELKVQFENAFKHLRSYYPNAKIPKIQTFVSGMGSSELYVSDSLIIIGLDYYVGPDATYRPLGYPDYILRRYSKEYIVPASILLLSHNYIEEDFQANNMLADMIYYGKKYYFSKKMMPCTPDSLLIWYSEEQLSDVKENQDIIWAHFVVNQLLYETSHLTKRKYLDERPVVYEIGNKCPGRIGTWLGWEIVDKYMQENPEVTLQELMENTDANQIFNESNYKPDRPGLFN